MATEDELKNLGALIKDVRQRRGRTQGQLAESVNRLLEDGSGKHVTTAYISNIENGNKQPGRTAITPSDEVLRAIAKSLGVPIVQFSAALGRVEGIEYLTDPDTARVAEAYSQLPDLAKRIVDKSIKSAAELAAELDREGAVGRRK